MDSLRPPDFAVLTAGIARELRAWGLPGRESLPKQLAALKERMKAVRAKL